MSKLPSAVAGLIGVEITGNVTPISWFEHLKHENGKPNLVAITILADIVYWHRPNEIRDETIPGKVKYERKFKHDRLQRSNNYYEELFGLTKKQTRDALKFLADAGLIEVTINPVEVINGKPLFNVKYVELIPKKLIEITYPMPYRSQGYDLQVTPPLPVSHTNTETSNGEFTATTTAATEKLGDYVSNYLTRNGWVSDGTAKLTQTILEQYPDADIVYAVGEAEKKAAATNEPPDLSYIVAVCDRRKRGEPDKKERNDHAPHHRRSQRSNSTPGHQAERKRTSDEIRAEAEALL